LTLAIRTPDHGKLTPWRFMIFTQEGRARAGAAFAARHRVLHPDADPSLSEVEHARFSRVPLVVGVVFSPKDSPKVPQWEQQLSAGAVCMNLLHAADSMGFGAKWLSEWIAYDRPVLTALGLEAHEQIAGYIYIGTQTAPEMDRPRPDIAQLSRWF
jgi:nitroreductase